MQTKFTFKHIDSSEAFQEYCEELLHKVESLLLKESKALVTLSLFNHEFQVDIQVPTQQKRFHAIGKNNSAYHACFDAVEKLEKQFLKTRQIQQNHRRPKLAREQREHTWRQTHQKLKKAA